MYAVGWFLQAEDPDSIGKLLYGTQIIINDSPQSPDFPSFGLNFFLIFQLLPLVFLLGKIF